MGCAVYVKACDPAALQAGDIVTYSKGTGSDLSETHRVVSNDVDSGKLTTKGDANAGEDIYPRAVQPGSGRRYILRSMPGRRRHGFAIARRHRCLHSDLRPGIPFVGTCRQVQEKGEFQVKKRYILMAVTAALVFAVAAGGTLAAQQAQGTTAVGASLEAPRLSILWNSFRPMSDGAVDLSDVSPGGYRSLDETYSVYNQGNVPAYVRVTVTKYWGEPTGEVDEYGFPAL